MSKSASKPVAKKRNHVLVMSLITVVDHTGAEEDTKPRRFSFATKAEAVAFEKGLAVFFDEHLKVDGRIVGLKTGYKPPAKAKK